LHTIQILDGLWQNSSRRPFWTKKNVEIPSASHLKLSKKNSTSIFFLFQKTRTYFAIHLSSKFCENQCETLPSHTVDVCVCERVSLSSKMVGFWNSCFQHFLVHGRSGASAFIHLSWKHLTLKTNSLGCFADTHRFEPLFGKRPGVVACRTGVRVGYREVREKKEKRKRGCCLLEVWLNAAFFVSFFSTEHWTQVDEMVWHAIFLAGSKEGGLVLVAFMRHIMCSNWEHWPPQKEFTKKSFHSCGIRDNN